jgi:hypothetical protein
MAERSPGPAGAREGQLEFAVVDHGEAACCAGVRVRLGAAAERALTCSPLPSSLRLLEASLSDMLALSVNEMSVRGGRGGARCGRGGERTLCCGGWAAMSTFAAASGHWAVRVVVPIGPVDCGAAYAYSLFKPAAERRPNAPPSCQGAKTECAASTLLPASAREDASLRYGGRSTRSRQPGRSRWRPRRRVAVPEVGAETRRTVRFVRATSFCSLARSRFWSCTQRINLRDVTIAKSEAVDHSNQGNPVTTNNFRRRRASRSARLKWGLDLPTGPVWPIGLRGGRADHSKRSHGACRFRVWSSSLEDAGPVGRAFSSGV